MSEGAFSHLSEDFYSIIDCYNYVATDTFYLFPVTIA